MTTIGGSQHTTSSPDSVGKRFSKERERLGLSRADFAFASGYSAEQIRKVELDERMPGGELLAALHELEGDVVFVLSGSSKLAEVRQRLHPYDSDKLPTMEELAIARQAQIVKREAREWRRHQSDRLKRVLTEDEADLMDAYRNLSASDRDRLLAMAVDGLASAAPKGGHHVSASGSSLAVGGDMNLGSHSGRRKK